MLIHSSVIHYSQKVEKPKCSSKDEWINKMWYIHNGKLFRLKKKKILALVITALKLTEISRVQKDKCSMISLI